MRTKFSGILTLVLVFVVQLTFAQQKTVSGLVADDNAIPLPGVDVVVKGTDRGTQTDFDGKYSIEVSPSDVLVFRYLGFQTQEVAVGNNTTINASLVSDTEILDDVVVTAYGGILKDSEVVSSVSRIKSENIEQIPIASLDQLLQGQAAGVNLRVASGQPGAAGTTIIRGRSSISGTTQPLYVLDGTPISADNFRNINPNDVEDISVLKDAAATAIYGNRGAAGVILITTKQASRNQAVKIQYRGLFGASQNLESHTPMMNTRQALMFRRDMVPGAAIPFGAIPTSELNVKNFTDAEIDQYSQVNTNWQNILFRTGRTESHDVTITAGSDNLSSFTSLQYFEQEGTTLRSKLRRFSLRQNFNGGDENLSYGANINISYSNSEFVVDATRGANTGGQLDNPFIVPFLGLPYLNPRNADGSLNTFGTYASGAWTDRAHSSINFNNFGGFANTPFIAMNTARNNTDTEDELRINTSVFGDWKPHEKITVGTRVGIDYIYDHNIQIDDPNSIRGLGRFATDPAILDQFNGGTQFESFFRDFNFNIVNKINYSDVYDEKHKLSVTLFNEYFYRNVQNGGFQAFGLNPKLPGSGAGFTQGATFYDPDPNNPSLDTRQFPFIPNAFSTEADQAILSYFGQATYDYDGRFGADVVIRRDGSSRFNSDFRWGTFYSIAGRWNIDREDFMEDIDWLSALKLRASYGEVGNQTLGGGFFNGFQLLSGAPGYRNQLQIAANTLRDETITWETTATTNVGVDFGMWNNRLTGALDVYRRKTTDLFFGNNISFAGTGFGNTQSNVGDLQNTGVDIQLAYELLRKSASSDWSLTINANLNYNENEILDINNEQGFVEGGSGARIAEGERAFTYFHQRWVGVDPSSGRPLYLDAQGDLTTSYDRAENGVYLDKQFDPVATGGFGLNASYKNVMLMAQFSYQWDSWKINSTRAITEDVSLANTANMNQSMLNAWQQPGDVTAIPSLGLGGLRGQAGDRYLEDASFLRLRNVNLAYNFDKEQLERWGGGLISGARIFLQGTNLITWTKWRGFDPEIGELGEFFNFPTPMTVSAGIDVTF